MPLKTQTITVVLADDHAIVRRSLNEFLATAGDIEVVAMAENGRQAIACAEKHVPDVLLLDLLMPDLPPVTTVREIKCVSPRTQIIGLSSYECSEFAAPASRAGATSYLLKNIGPDNLVAAVRKAAAGEAVICPTVAQSLLTSIEQGDQTVVSPVDLNAREIKILRWIANAKSNDIIANALGIDVKAVKAHVSNILAKFYLRDKAESIFGWREKVKQ